MTTPATRIGQATAIESSRAEAEVKAAVFIAQQTHRNIDAAQEEMRFACRQVALAEKAFFSYPRGNEDVTGPSIHLARELALIWGNIQHGTMELSRDTMLGQSEILAYAWDLQRNSRSSQIFIAPHVRDTKRGKKDLTDLRDVYENNANLGARRLREAIYAVLPAWYTAEAITICQQTLKQGSGEPLEDRISKAISGYDRFGVSVKQLEDKVGRPVAKWAAEDVAQLGVIFRSVQRGEMSRDEAFPPAHVTSAEITRQPRPAAERPPVGEPADNAHADAVAALLAFGEEFGAPDIKQDAFAELGVPLEAASAQSIRELVAKFRAAAA